MDRQAEQDIRRKLKCLRFARDKGSVILACRLRTVSPNRAVSHR